MLRAFEGLKNLNRPIIPAIVLFSIIVLVSYSYRWVFSYHYNPEQMEEIYQGSQYVWPRGPYTLDDDTYYKIVGYKIAEGFNPFSINIEQPPFAKALYGISTHLFGNPYYVSFFLFVLSIPSIFLLALEVSNSKETAWISTILFIANPLVAYQASQTMLDFPQTLLFIVHLIFLLKLKETKEKDINVILAGLFLGLMSGAKIAFYLPVILIMDSIYLYKVRSLKLLPKLLFSSVVGYVASWFIYFIRHPNPIPWLRLHRHLFEFYQAKRLTTVDVENVFRTIFFNRYFQWAASPARMIPMLEWSILLPSGLIANIYFFLKTKVYWKKSVNLAYISLIGIAFLIMNSLVPFWPRYLVVIIPIYSILVAMIIAKSKTFLILFVGLYILALCQFLV